jgi:chorismate mutase/prephenate dehydratase
MPARKPPRPAKRRVTAPRGKAKGGLSELRREIDRVDAALHALINERARLARAVGVSKHADGHLVDFYRPEREAEVLRLALERNQAARESGTLRDEEVLRLFREIMSACLAQEEPLKVAFLGPEGTFTQTAVYKHFGHSVRALPLPAIDEVFHEVEKGNADFGVVPIENSTEGTVNHTLDRFLNSPLKICGEVELRIHQYLMGRMTDLAQISRICSHAQSLAQCRGWLNEHLPNIERVPVASNAEAARRARDEVGTAAIAGKTAAEVYGLTLLATEIEDRPDNTTRFFVIGRRLFKASGADRTSLLVSTNETTGPGALHRLLGPLAKHGINLTRIESRPSQRRKWDYVFFIDIEGHIDEPNVAAALEGLKSQASLYRVLGSYPRALL